MTTDRTRFTMLLFPTAFLLLTAALMGTAAGADSLVLEGGTVHSMAAEPRVATVWIQDGIIRGVGDAITAPADAKRLDVSGLHVYPGMLDAFSRVGLTEIGAVPATVDTAELGEFNPHLTAATAVHPASEVIPVTRSTGITHSLSAPAAQDEGIVPGQASLIHLDGWTVDDMAIAPSAAMVIEWPEIETRTFNFATFSVREKPFGEAQEEAEQAQEQLLDWVDAARHYRQAAGSPRLERNLRLEALTRILDGGMPVLIRADAKRDIEAAVHFAVEQDLRMILVGGRDAFKVKDLLVEHDIPVILGLTLSLPEQDDDPYDRPFRTPGELRGAGIQIAFGSSAGGGFGPGGPHGARTLPYEAAVAVAHGLDETEALRALTLYPAQMLGLGDRLGTVEAGKVANLIVTDGSPLELTTRVHHLLIDGREVTTDNKHERLFRKYRDRPEPPAPAGAADRRP
ncbi:MAG: amidohydrolase family protein [Acidobacteriota bacterium]